jgi:hypothetical protein
MSAGAADPDLIQTPFPAHALAPLEREMAEALAQSLSIKPDLAYACAMAAASAACGRSLMTPSGPGRVLGANLYFLGAAHSGLGKSSVFRPIFEPIYSYQKDCLTRFIEIDRPAMLLEQMRLKKDLEIYKKSMSKKNFLPGQEDRMKKIFLRLEELELLLKSPCRIICEDITTEALAIALAANREQIFSVSADADKVFRNLEGRYVSGNTLDESLYVKAFSRDSHWVDRISRAPIYLKSPCMTVLWLTQPNRLTRLFENKEFRDGGLLPRFLVISRANDVQESPPTIRKIDGRLQYAYHSMLRGLLTTFWDCEKQCLLPESPDVNEFLRCYYNTLVPRMNGGDRDISPFLKRRTEKAWRIALGRHAVTFGDGSVNQPIALKSAEGAVEIVEWFAAEEERVLIPVRESVTSDWLKKLVDFLRTRPGWEASTRDIMRKFTWTKTELDKLLKDFGHFFDRQTNPPPKRGGHQIESIRLKKQAGGYTI